MIDLVGKFFVKDEMIGKIIGKVNDSCYAYIIHEPFNCLHESMFHVATLENMSGWDFGFTVQDFLYLNNMDRRECPFLDFLGEK